MTGWGDDVAAPSVVESLPLGAIYVLALLVFVLGSVIAGVLLP